MVIADKIVCGVRNPLYELLNKPVVRAVPEVMREAVFFAAFYIYLWLAVDLRFIYHGGGLTMEFPTFFTGWEFFKPFLSRPGGLVDYVSAFLSQLLYVGWVGPLVVTAQVWLLGLLADRIVKTATGPSTYFDEQFPERSDVPFGKKTIESGHATLVKIGAGWWVRFVPAVILLVPYTQYAYHFGTTMSLLTGLAFAWIYIKSPPKNRVVRLAIFTAILLVVYATAGAAVFVFAVICVLYEMLSAGRWSLAVAYLVIATSIPYFACAALFNRGPGECLEPLLPYWRNLHFQADRRMMPAVYALWGFLPAILLSFGLWAALSKRQPAPVERPESQNVDARAQFSAKVYHAVKWVVGTIVLFAVAAGGAGIAYDEQVKTLLTVEFYARLQMWPQVIETARRHPINSFFIAHIVNQALYHTGRLADDMFTFPQHRDALFLTAKMHSVAEWKRFDVYLEMGHVNMAEHGLAESLEVFGDRPAILKRVALVNMVKGRNAVARVYLNALTRTLFEADWARGYLAQLDADPNLTNDEQIQQIRTFMVGGESDFGFGTSAPPEASLLALLARNRHNKMAFEYLMALHLVTGQLEDFVRNLDRLDDFDYPQIPRAYEEAVLLYENLQKKTVDLHGRKIGDSSRRRLAGFLGTLNRYGGKEAAYPYLARDYGDTYFFYYVNGPRE